MTFCSVSNFGVYEAYARCDMRFRRSVARYWGGVLGRRDGVSGWRDTPGQTGTEPGQNRDTRGLEAGRRVGYDLGTNEQRLSVVGCRLSGAGVRASVVRGTSTPMDGRGPRLGTDSEEGSNESKETSNGGGLGRRGSWQRNSMARELGAGNGCRSSELEFRTRKMSKITGSREQDWEQDNEQEGLREPKDARRGYWLSDEEREQHNWAGMGFGRKRPSPIERERGFSPASAGLLAPRVLATIEAERVEDGTERTAETMVGLLT